MHCFMGWKEGDRMIWFLLIACGLGALVRYFFSKVNSRAALPIGTLMANVLGAFLIGVFYNHIQDKQLYSISDADLFFMIFSHYFRNFYLKIFTFARILI